MRASQRRMFKALADVGVNIQMISTSEIKISVIIEEKFLELAVRTCIPRLNWMQSLTVKGAAD